MLGSFVLMKPKCTQEMHWEQNKSTMYQYKDTEQYHTCTITRLCVSTDALCFIQCIVDFWWFSKYAKNIFDNSKILGKHLV